MEVYTCTPREVRKFIKECLYAGLVPMVHSSPGMGKSAIMKDIASELSLKLIDHRLSTSPPEDLSGLPRFNEKGEAFFSPFAELFPLDYMEVPKGYDGWMLFLDEITSAKRDTIAAAYKLILDRMTGQKRLHERCVITAAGNLITDRAVVNPIGTAMQSRLVHLEMRTDFNEWLEDVAIAQNYDKRIIAFLSQYPSKLMDFRPDHNEKTFCCPRTWEFTNKLIQGKKDISDLTPLLVGTITSGAAIDFVQFSKIYTSLVPVSEVLKDPENCRIPNTPSAQWAMTSSLLDWVKEDNYSDLATYINRFPLTFRILFFRYNIKKNPELLSHKATVEAMTTIAQYLQG